MSSNPKDDKPSKDPPPAPIVRALNQSEEVRTKVDHVAEELSSVNSVLKSEITGQFTLAEIERAVHRSENIESKVHEVAQDLTEVQGDLTQEVHERAELERELTETQLQEQEARQLAFHDSVTSLPNRNLFNDRLQHGLAQAERHKRRLAVMFIDLDKFKRVNDSYGHDAGDAVLQMVAERLLHSVRAEDTVSRHGGDEFVVLLLEIRDESDVEAMARKINRAVADDYSFNGTKLNIEASIGIAIYPNDGDNAETLVKNADTAMYRAKKGRTRYCFFSNRTGGSQQLSC